MGMLLQGEKDMPVEHGEGVLRKDMFSQELKRNISFYIP
jgi:hypothetical protein